MKIQSSKDQIFDQKRKYNLKPSKMFLHRPQSNLLNRKESGLRTPNRKDSFLYQMVNL